MYSSLLYSWLIIAATAAFVVRFRRMPRGTRRNITLGYAASLAALLLLSTYPIENLFYSFPSPWAVAAYACDGDVAAVVDGGQSSLIVYQTRSGAQSCMISPKTDSGYKIGRMSAAKHTDAAISGIGFARLFQSAEVPDLYILVDGSGSGEHVAVEDSIGSEFKLFTLPPSTFSYAGAEITQTRFYAAAYLGSELNAPYELSVTDDGGEKAVIFSSTPLSSYSR